LRKLKVQVGTQPDTTLGVPEDLKKKLGGPGRAFSFTLRTSWEVKPRQGGRNDKRGIPELRGKSLARLPQRERSSLRRVIPDWIVL